jgi:hypothetical protein
MEKLKESKKITKKKKIHNALYVMECRGLWQLCSLRFREDVPTVIYTL